LVDVSAVVLALEVETACSLFKISESRTPSWELHSILISSHNKGYMSTELIASIAIFLKAGPRA
jgi:hypothetical protein